VSRGLCKEMWRGLMAVEKEGRGGNSWLEGGCWREVCWRGEV